MKWNQCLPVLGLWLCGAVAASTPVGQWHTVDDKTGEVKSMVTIEDRGGALSGRVTQILRKGADPAARCDQCADDRKGQPILGMEIIRGVKKSAGQDHWEGGEILDPNNGKTYKVRIKPIDGGKKLEVRGFIGAPMLGRTQTWIRVE